MSSRKSGAFCKRVSTDARSIGAPGYRVPRFASGSDAKTHPDPHAARGTCVWCYPCAVDARAATGSQLIRRLTCTSSGCTSAMAASPTRPKGFSSYGSFSTTATKASSGSAVAQWVLSPDARSDWYRRSAAERCTPTGSTGPAYSLSTVPDASTSDQSCWLSGSRSSSIVGPRCSYVA